MNAPKVRDHAWPTQLFRIATLLAPSALASSVVFSQPDPRRLVDPQLHELAGIVTWTLAPLWILVACGLVARREGRRLGRSR